MNRRAVLPVVISLLALAVAACGSTPGGESDGSAPAATVAASTVAPASAQTLPATVISSDGREVTVTDTSRVVSLWGNLTEVVVALGLGDRLVGRDIASTLPEVEHLPIVTNGHDVAAEALLSLNPTLVLATDDTGPATAVDQIRSVGVPIVRFSNPTSVQDIAPRVRAVAEALGVPERGDEFLAELDRQLTAVLASVPEGQRPPRVAFLYMRGQAGVYLIGGPGSGADSMITAAGAIDAGTEMGLDRSFTPITSEALVTAAPDVILMTTTGLESVGGVDGLVQIPGIAQTPAGAQRRIVTVDDGVLYSFGPRTPLALCQLMAGLYSIAPSEACAEIAR